MEESEYTRVTRAGSRAWQRTVELRADEIRRARELFVRSVDSYGRPIRPTVDPTYEVIWYDDDLERHKIYRGGNPKNSPKEEELKVAPAPELYDFLNSLGVETKE